MRKVFFPLLILLISLPTVWPFFQKGFFETHDIIYLTRMSAAAYALADGQFPLRWIPNFRYGEPLFNYYAPLPYYFGALIHSIGFDFITSTKIIFILITFSAGLAIYLLLKEYWGKWGGACSALLYIYAPYRAVDLYIRGALSEIFAFTWFPLIFLAYLKFFTRGQKSYLLLGAVFLALLILTHNIMALLFIPFLLAFIALLVFRGKKWSSVPAMIGSICLAFGLTTSYWLPALWEKSLVQIYRTALSLDNLLNHFALPQDFIKPKWDGFYLTHELGLVHLFFGMMAILTAVFLWKRQKEISLFILFIGLLLLLSLFMETVYSLPLWLSLTPFQFIQFPWRFSGISIFLLAILGGAFFTLLRVKRGLAGVIFGIAFLVTFLTLQNYFQPNSRRPEATDKDFINLNEAYLPKEYLPLEAKVSPPQEINVPVLATNFKPAGATDIARRSNAYAFKIETKAQEEIIIPIYYFPGWKVFEKQKEIDLEKQPKTGLITLPLPEGKHDILLKFTDTPVRQIGNWLSLFSLGLTLICLGITVRPKSSP